MKENSYMVQAECITAIGLCGSKQETHFIQKASSVKSTRNVIANAASRALKKMTDDGK
jgi:hypothetical protein